MNYEVPGGPSGSWQEVMVVEEKRVCAPVESARVPWRYAKPLVAPFRPPQEKAAIPEIHSSVWSQDSATQAAPTRIERIGGLIIDEDEDEAEMLCYDAPSSSRITVLTAYVRSPSSASGTEARWGCGLRPLAGNTLS